MVLMTLDVRNRNSMTFRLIVQTNRVYVRISPKTGLNRPVVLSYAFA